MAESILFSGISMGHLQRSNGEILRPVVWLTTDSAPEGHGLLTGDEILTNADIRHLERVQGAPIRNSKTKNKMQIRLKIKMPSSDRSLISFDKWCKKNESVGFAKRTGLSVYYKVNELSRDEFERLCQTTRTKESTWWLYFGVIAPNLIQAVDIKRESVFENYDFERNGRSGFRQEGFIVPKREAVSELSTLCEPDHKFDSLRAFCFCANLTLEPHVIIRGRGMYLALRIADAEIFYGKAPQQIAELRSWVARHRAELQSCWEDAVAIYRDYHPNA